MMRIATVRDVSGEVRLAQRDGNYEAAIPLDVLGLRPEPGLETRGDIGVLLGAGGETQVRIYWNGGGAFTVADVPTEAQFNAETWGTFRFAVQ